MIIILSIVDKIWIKYKIIEKKNYNGYLLYYNILLKTNLINLIKRLKVIPYLVIFFEKNFWFEIKEQKNVFS